jgi:hypothetical protein
MKITLNLISTISISAIMLLSSCSKKAEDAASNINNTTNTPSVTTPTFADGYGTLAAVATTTYQLVSGMNIPVQLNLGVAAFYASGSGSMTDGGTVTINGKALTKQSNNSYVYQSLTDPLSFSGAISWNVSGSSSVPAISYSNDRPVPTYSDYTSLPSTVTRSAGFTVSLSGKVSGADSIYVVLIGSGSSVIIKHVGGAASGCVFSASDLSGMNATSTGIIEVCPWNYKSEDFSSKKFYFVNEAAYVKTGVTIN